MILMKKKNEKKFQAELATPLCIKTTTTTTTPITTKNNHDNK